MESSGFQDSVIKWLQSYLLSRKFFVVLEDVFLEAGLINCVILHESILGSLIVLIYINDLPQGFNEIGSYPYADNTFYQDKDIEKVQKVFVTL